MDVRLLLFDCIFVVIVFSANNLLYLTVGDSFTMQKQNRTLYHFTVESISPPDVALCTFADISINVNRAASSPELMIELQVVQPRSPLRQRLAPLTEVCECTHEQDVVLI